MRTIDLDKLIEKLRRYYEDKRAARGTATLDLDDPYDRYLFRMMMLVNITQTYAGILNGMILRAEAEGWLRN